MHSISSLVTTVRREQIGVYSCRVQFPCEWDLHVGLHAWETLKKMNGHLRYFSYITRILFFKICISVHINRYVACLSFNSMSGRGFCYVLVLFSPKEGRLEYKESY